MRRVDYLCEHAGAVELLSGSESQISSTQPGESGAIATHDFCIEHFRRREDPCIVFTQTLASPRLQQGTPACVRPRDRMHGKAGEGPRGNVRFSRAFEKFLHGDDRKAEFSPVQPRQPRDRRTRSTGARLALKRNEKGRIKQERRPVIHG